MEQSNKENNVILQNSKKRRFLFVLGPVIILIVLVGVTYSFFNYTRTGGINNLGTGRIYFYSNQSNTLNITNVFPMTSSEANEANLDSVTISITGDTTYTDGEEFEISLVNVTNTINGKSIPINYRATYTRTASDKTIGTSSNDYWNARNSKDASIYLLNAEGRVTEGKQVLVGYIDNGATGINGTLTISAYIDASRIAISDTYYGNTPTPNPSASPLPTPTITPGPSDEYGTTDEWVDGRVVLTTSEWNSLASTPISFKIRAESNEGIWVEEPGKIKSCPGCKFMYYVIDSSDYTTFKWTMWNDVNETPTVITSGLYDNYEELIGTINKNYFLGVKLNSNNEVTNAYVCAVKDAVPFCIEGTNDGSKYTENQTLLQEADLWNNSCTVDTSEGSTTCGPWDDSGPISVEAYSNGFVFNGVGDADYCEVSPNGFFICSESEPSA